MKKSYESTSDKRTLGKEAVSLVCSALLVLLIAFFVSGTVSGQTTDKLSVDERYYQELEADYVREIRGYLNACGFENSGVSLTRTVSIDGSREYEITLHHKYLEKLEEAQLNDLFTEIEGMAFQAEGCMFRAGLLTCDR